MIADILTALTDGLKRAPALLLVFAVSFIGWYGLIFLQPAFLLQFGYWQWLVVGLGVHLGELIIFGLAGWVFGSD